MYCGKCGSGLSDGAKFCPACGSPTNAASAPQSAPANPQLQPQVTVNNYQMPVADPNSYQKAQAPVSGAPAACPPAITTNRGLLMYILLTIVTCGLYGYWYVYSLAKDINRMCAADGSKIGGLAAYILLSFITCGIYQYYWQYKIANRLQNNAPLYGLSFPEGGSTILLWDIVGLFLCGIGPFVAMHILLKNTNAMAAAYNARIGR